VVAKKGVGTTSWRVAASLVVVRHHHRLHPWVGVKKEVIFLPARLRHHPWVEVKRAALLLELVDEMTS
jgi:hypothetical protein